MKQPGGTPRGFSLIELLVVIAIIAILVGLSFPVFSRVREGVRQTACMSQMHDIFRALQQYRLDNNKYPAALLGFVQISTKDANGNLEYFTGANGTPVTIDQLTYRPLTTEQKYINDKGTFHCPDSDANDPTITASAVFPPGLPLTGNVTFTPLIHHNIGDTKPVPDGQNAYFYRYDSYDIGPQVDKTGKPTGVQNELHYSLDWTGLTGAADKCPSHPDGLCGNQLKYNDPPADKTVITWCTWHAAINHSDKVMVLTLDGKVRPVPVDQFINKGPLNFGY